uniref:Uncharacterized protein n=1 Tax=Castor canadensis TaxID=51338 RepID=A0A8C0XHU9_CASCN
MFLKCILPRSRMNLLRLQLSVSSPRMLQKPTAEKAVVRFPLKTTLLMILKMNEFSALQSFRSSSMLFINSYRFCPKYLSIS